MPAHTRSGSLFGLSMTVVDVEVDIQNGLPKFVIVGLPDSSVKEARDRVTSALKNSGFGFPRTHIVANLAPADVRKEGAVFDVPLAVGILAASGVIPAHTVENTLFFGELGLDGSLRPINGLLPLLLGVRNTTLTDVIVAEDNAVEAGLVSGLTLFRASHLRDIVAHFRGESSLARITPTEPPLIAGASGIDLADIAGQHHGKRALEICAAGGHNLLLHGPPGSGKTMLARALPSILPPLTREELLEVMMLRSIHGENESLSPMRPFRTPHHTTSGIALIGGGTHPKPGEVTLAHRGVLFLDEFPEFRRDALENLRQPLEDGTVSISRASGNVRYPARFQLIAAMNPCPCGYAGDGTNRCSCTSQKLLSYDKKISGPIKDRIDLHVSVPRLSTGDVLSSAPQESSADVRARVCAARMLQQTRYASSGFFTNHELSGKLIKLFCPLPRDAQHIFETALERLHLSARAANRVIKVSRTIADLAGRESILASDVSEALQYRETH